MNERQFYIDWIRIFLIFSVFLYHVGMIFNGWGWHIKNDIRIDALNPIMSMLHAWRMPLLFLVSGAGTRFALGIRQKGAYAAERTKRLFLPLLIGMFTLVPVQVYIERVANYPNLFNFYLHLFEGSYPQGNFSWHHLWFLVYLYFISMVFLPLIGFYRSGYYQKFENFMERLAHKKCGLVILFIPVLISQALLRPYFPHETHAFIDDWASMAMFFLYFIYGFILSGSISIMSSVEQQRRIWLILSIVSTILLFILPGMMKTHEGGSAMYGLISYFMSWVISLAILGYSRKYFNTDHPLRKPLNTAIYPFYLLHQPILIVIAFYVLPLGFPIIVKALTITLTSLMAIWFIYRWLIAPANLMRVVFGMRKKQRNSDIRLKAEE